MVNQVKKYNRFFSFGCSFTQHLWPTWADIISLDLGIPFQNWGKTGAGNVAIQSRIVECDFANDLTTDDLVIVVWTGWNREDRYIGKWLCGGMIFNNWNYDQNFLEKYWSIENDYIKSTTAIHTTFKAYKDIIKYHGAITLPEHKLEYNHNYSSFLKEKDLNLANKILNNFYQKSVSLQLFDWSSNSQFNGKCFDIHPDILCHLKFVTDKIYPSFNLKIKESTIKFCYEYYNEASKRLEKTDSYDTITKKILKLNDEIGFEQKIWGI